LSNAQRNKERTVCNDKAEKGRNRDAYGAKKGPPEGKGNTYDDSRFLVGRGLPEDCDFTQGLNRNRTEFISKDTLFEEIRACQYARIGSMPAILTIW